MGRKSNAALLLLSTLCIVVNALSWSPFGTVLGVTDGDVEVYSCHLKPNEMALDQGANYVGNVYTGVKWQCVEVARRYLLVNYGVVFEDIDYAFQIFDLNTVVNPIDQSRYAFNKFVNGGSIRPKHGSLLIWSPYGEMGKTGHVAVVVNVTDKHIDIVEQNVEDTIWPKGQKYSRRLKVKQNSSSYFIEKWYDEEHILGWITVDLNTPITLTTVSKQSSWSLTYSGLVLIAVVAALFAYRNIKRSHNYQRVL